MRHEQIDGGLEKLFAFLIKGLDGYNSTIYDKNSNYLQRTASTVPCDCPHFNEYLCLLMCPKVYSMEHTIF